MTEGFSAAFANPLPSIQPVDILWGIAAGVFLWLAVRIRRQNQKKYRHGVEYGSARWGTPADIAPYMDPDFFQNIPMTQTERITMASRPKNPKYARNKNILVIGGSGSGKTRFFCKPSLLQAHSSYVVTDPKGTLLPEIGTFLVRKHYRIKCLNLINFKKSMKYNPLSYIRSEKDILKLVNALIMNTKGEGEKSSEDFWVKAERLYYSALIGYIWYEAPEEERNFTMLLDFINASEARENDENYQSPVDILFAKLAEKEPDHFAVRQYRKFKMAAGKTLKSILVSCGARLASFDIKELRDLMETDELELDTLGDEKTALFVILSDTDSTFNFVAALMYSQLFNLLCDKADDFYGGRLPVHVRLILDEFANKTDNYFVKAKLNQDEGVYYVTGHTANKEDATHFVPVKTGDTKGRILIKGLEDDTFSMTEVRTDSGYVLLKQDIEVVISQKESADSCTVYASDTLGLIQNDPRYAQIIQSNADLKNIPQKHLEHKLRTASATVSGKKVNMVEDNGSVNAEAPLTVVNTRGFDLPKTGDNGTMMFTIVGILLMVGAAVVLYLVSNKKSA